MRTLLHNARLHDPRSGWLRPGSLLLEGGRISRLLPAGLEPGGPLRRVDCAGHLLMPGLFDAHVHLVFGGESLTRLNAAAFPQRSELLQEIACRAATVTAGPERRDGWVLGQGLQPGPLVPTLAELDEATGAVPLCLDTHDLHSCICNSSALALVGVAERPDPPGGEVERDREGRPTGFLRENAALWLRPVIPAASDEDRLGFLLAAQAHAHGLGITGVGDNLRRADLPLLQQLEREDRLRLRIQGWRNDGNLVADTLELEPWFSSRVRVDTLKLFADGALGSCSAALDEPYLDGRRGTLVAAPEDLTHWMRRGLERGWRLAVHAIGDLAVARVLDFFEELGREGLPVRGWRHRIEHVQFLRPEDVERFRRLEIIPSVQPLHCATDQDGFETRLGAASRARAFRWRSLLEAGLPLPIGTDWPVEPLDPRLNLVHGVTRASRGGLNLIGLDEALNLPELLRGMTWDAAHAAGWGDELGCLSAGAHADLLLWEEDPFSCSTEDLARLHVRALWSGGEAVVEPEA
jgi:predicted amidohydrolase YtcJ